MADTMTLEELRESLDVGCLPNTDRPRWFAAIDAAIKQREQGAKDAARYRWLADSEDGDLFMENPGKELLDRAIDAAMAGESGR